MKVFRAQTVAALAVTLLIGCAWSPDNPAAVFQLIDKRLSYMEDVALYKHANAIPVEDKKRELTVIAKAKQQAESFNLSPPTVERFTKAQIEVAKNIQNRAQKRWRKQGAPGGEPEDLKKIRRALIKTGREINSAISRFLESGGTFDGLYPQFKRAVKTGWVTEEDKRELFDALCGVRVGG